jgi:hypothetical protein
VTLRTLGETTDSTDAIARPSGTITVLLAPGPNGKSLVTAAPVTPGSARMPDSARSTKARRLASLLP